jgi:hypothetical protein
VGIASNASFNVPASIIPLSAGPELMMVYVQSDTKIMVTTRTSATWTAPIFLYTALTNNRVALAPLPGGGAIMAFRGTDGKAYWSTYTSGAWSSVAALYSPNISISGSPAVTHGIGGKTAEIAFVQGDGKAYHASLSSGTWSVPETVGGTSLVGVAITSMP